MSTTVSAFITDLDTKYPNPYTNANKLVWINEIESNIYADNVKSYLVQYYRKVLDTYQYSLPSGVTFEDIHKLFVDGVEYDRVDVRTDGVDGTYWYEGSKINIHPKPSDSDTSYTSGASEITFASGTITTTGADFSEFYVGDTVLVSGCLLATGNNKYAEITAVAAKVLTFVTGTFTAQAEVAAITISAPKIKMIYKSNPTAKLIANIATDTLLIPDRFVKVYTWFCIAQMSALNREFTDYNSYTTLFNTAVAEYLDWYASTAPLEPLSNCQQDESW